MSSTLASEMNNTNGLSHDLMTVDGLTDAYREAGSWEALSRTSGVPASTLKSRASRLHVQKFLELEELSGINTASVSAELVTSEAEATDEQDRRSTHSRDIVARTERTQEVALPAGAKQLAVCLDDRWRSFAEDVRIDVAMSSGSTGPSGLLDVFEAEWYAPKSDEKKALVVLSVHRRCGGLLHLGMELDLDDVIEGQVDFD